MGTGWKFHLQSPRFPLFWPCPAPRRLAKKGYIPQKKISKSQPYEKQRAKRVAWVRRHQHRDATAWKAYLQAVADMKLFTYYPKHLKSAHRRLRASWTYMNNKEKYQTAFQRPKRWFPKEEYKKTKKQKVFGS